MFPLATGISPTDLWTCPGLNLVVVNIHDVKHRRNPIQRFKSAEFLSKIGIHQLLKHIILGYKKNERSQHRVTTFKNVKSVLIFLYQNILQDMHIVLYSLFLA